MRLEVKVWVAKCAVIFSAAPLLINAYEYGPDAGEAGVPGENGSCSQSGCHTGTPVNGGGGNVTVTFPNGMIYTPGSMQHLVVTITDPKQRRWGFELTARLTSDPRQMAGSFSSTDKRTQLMCASRDLVQQLNINTACPANLPLEYVEQTLAGYTAVQASPGRYEFDWNPPAANVGPVTVYVSAVAANGDLTQNGDHVYTAGYTLAATAAQTCTFTLTASQQTFPQSGGSGTVNIIASSGTCARIPTSTVSWITIVFGQQGTGNGTIGFTVAADTDTPMRTGAISVGAQSITITQTGPACNFAINPRSANLSPLAQNGTFALSGLSGCTWNASSNATWLQVTSADSGMGPANIGYAVQANPGTARSGTITVAGLTFTVNQSGACAYTLNPAGGSYPSSGRNGSFTVSSNAGCAWNASTGDSWIRVVSGASGSGPGQVTFAVDPNTGDARTGTIAVAGQTFTVAQASFTCSFILTPTSTAFPSTGGTATFSVATTAGCAWTAATTASWITIVTGASGSGAGVVGISAGANPGDVRTGTVTAGGQIFTVTQAGAGIAISAGSIANAASWAPGMVSPGMIVTIAVPGIGPATTVSQQLSADGTAVTTSLGGAQVLFDGIAAPMLYAASGQFSAVVPYEVASNTQLQVEYQGVLSNTVSVPVVASEPGLFTADSSGGGQGLIFDAMGNPNSSSNPAAAESVVTLYVTGEGQTSPPGIDGLIATSPAPAPVAPVSVTIDGIDATVVYYGGAVGQVAGMMRIDVQIPDGTASGARPVVARVGDAQSQSGVTVAIQ